MAIPENYHVAPSISLVNIVLPDQSIGHASSGMLVQDNVSRLSEVIMMKCWMLLSIAQVTNLLQQVLMVLQESIMFSLEHAQLFFRVMKMKYQKFNSTLKETRLLLHQVIRHVVFGTQILELSNKY